MSVEVWKSIFDVAAVILLFLTFLAGAGVLLTGNVINSRQAAELRTFDSDLTVAKIELGKQQELVAKADEKVAGLEKAALDAKAAQQTVELELSKQKEQTAKAEIALEELREAGRPRELTPHQKELLIKNLKPLSKTPVKIECVMGSPEAKAYSLQIWGVLLAAGWGKDEIPLVEKFFPIDPVGIGFEVKNVRFQSPSLRNIQAAFATSDLPLSIVEDKDGAADEGITIVVGLKPTPHSKAN